MGTQLRRSTETLFLFLTKLTHTSSSSGRAAYRDGYLRSRSSSIYLRFFITAVYNWMNDDDTASRSKLKDRIYLCIHAFESFTNLPQWPSPSGTLTLKPRFICVIHATSGPSLIFLDLLLFLDCNFILGRRKVSENWQCARSPAEIGNKYAKCRLIIILFPLMLLLLLSLPPQGGHVFIGVSLLFVYLLAGLCKKLLNRFSQNLVER